MVYFSSDLVEVERVSKQLTSVGITNEVRPSIVVNGRYPHPPEAEVWVRNDADCSEAFLQCLQCRAGFAKRKPTAFELDPWRELAAA